MPRVGIAFLLMLGSLAATGCEKLVGIHEVCKGPDTDGDGTPNCSDECPYDPDKSRAGLCGCGIGDVDADRDGYLDCHESCPRDPTRLARGTCGCGVLDDQPLCLVHRYTFDEGDGATKFLDSVGSAHGTAAEPPLAGGGAAVFRGGVAEYVTLPSTIVSSLGDELTIELWASWTDAGRNARFFDFGNNQDFGASEASAPGQQGDVGVHYLFTSPLGGSMGGLSAGFSNGGPTEQRIAEGPPMAPSNADELQHIAIVVSAENDALAVYRNGRQEASTKLGDLRPSFIKDVNNWLGRSQFRADPPFKGTLAEFRIYSVARTPEQLRASVLAGPDALPAR